MLAGCDRRQVSGCRRCRGRRAREGKVDEVLTRSAELDQELLEALTLTCGVVDWWWFGYSESSRLLRYSARRLLQASALGGADLRERQGAVRPAKVTHRRRLLVRSGIRDLMGVGDIIVPSVFFDFFPATRVRLLT